ncbi:hypothetical protein [Amycolatopsis magusensis]|uniref:hypothetical protein n=1 Tax=Amycolatopsis magusensis TaxID=882444 RepID=UPI0037B7162B
MEVHARDRCGSEDPSALDANQTYGGAVERIMNLVRSTPPDDGESGVTPGPGLAGRGSSPATSQPPTEDGNAVIPQLVWAELELLKYQAQEGDGASARRVAEILDLVQPGSSEISTWWRRAAELQDPDALDYVEHFIG